MMSYFIILAILCIEIAVGYDPTTWKLANPLHYEDPTPSEILQAFARKGHECWGQQMRVEGEIRLLMIGGSQTAEVEEDGSGLSNLIHEHLQNKYGPKSYALNRGRGSTLPKAFIGSKYGFEEWDTSLWPNCVMIDFTLNSLAEEGWNSARDAEKVIRSIKYKYLLRGLRVPDFFFIEYMMIVGFHKDDLSGEYSSKALRHHRLNRLSGNVSDSFFAGNGFNRGCINCAFFNQLADFHGYPVLSIRNALFPGFQRFHLDLKPNDIDIYYLIADGIHLSVWGRCFVMNYIVDPFWKSVMAPRVETPMRSIYSHIYDADISMMAVEPINIEVVRWTSWGTTKNTLMNITAHSSGGGRRAGGRHGAGAGAGGGAGDSIKVSDDISSTNRRNQWSFVSTLGHEDDRGHICYGSSVPDSVALFNFRAPVECSAANPCVLQISAVHSWNQTHYGDMTCTLIRGGTGEHGRNRTTTDTVGLRSRGMHHGRRNHTRIRSVIITSELHNRKKIRNTLPLETLLDSNVTAGQYSIQCTKNDKRLSCISSITISQMLLV